MSGETAAPEPLSEETLQEWERLCEVSRALSVAVEYGIPDDRGQPVTVRVKDECGKAVALFASEADAQQWVSARTAMPLLLAELRRLREERRDYVLVSADCGVYCHDEVAADAAKWRKFADRCKASPGLDGDAVDRTAHAWEELAAALASKGE